MSCHKIALAELEGPIQAPENAWAFVVAFGSKAKSWDNFVVGLSNLGLVVPHHQPAKEPFEIKVGRLIEVALVRHLEKNLNFKLGFPIGDLSKMKPIPTLQKYMTYVPKTIGFDQPLEQAIDYMRKLHVRHLPVLRGGKLVGIVSDRDINMVMTLRDVDAATLKVEEALTPDPYFTTPDAPLDEVAALMAEKKFGCALIMDNNKIVGIFTANDALRALSELLKSRLAG